MKIKVGIVGNGIVGKAIRSSFKDNVEVKVYDINGEFEDRIENLKDCEYVYICVPTPFSKSKGHIYDYVISSVNSFKESDCKVIIESALLPECIDLITIDRSRLLVIPEHLSEKNSMSDYRNQYYLIIGCDNDNSGELYRKFVKTYTICRFKEFAYIGIKEACLLKFMENSFLGLKVIFMNEFCRYYGVNGEQWTNLMNVFHMDNRMGTSHYQVPGHDGSFGFGGKCLPKDIMAITKYARDSGAPLLLMEKVLEINDSIRDEKDWLEINGAVIE